MPSVLAVSRVFSAATGIAVFRHARMTRMLQHCPAGIVCVCYVDSCSSLRRGSSEITPTSSSSSMPLFICLDPPLLTLRDISFSLPLTWPSFTALREGVCRTTLGDVVVNFCTDRALATATLAPCIPILGVIIYNSP